LAEKDKQQRAQTICLLILTALAITGALYLFKSVLIPFVLAIFLTICLSPVIDAQVKKFRIPRPVAILTTVLLGCALLALMGLLVTIAANEIVQSRDEYLTQVNELLVKTGDLVPEDWHVVADPNDTSETLVRIPSNTIRKVLTDTASSIMNVLSNGLLVLIFMIFMVAGKPQSKASAGTLWNEVESRINRYVITMAVTSGVTGLLVGLTLTFIGVKFGWMFGFLAFLLNFIPNIGSIIATLLPLPVAFIDPELGIVAKALVIIIPGLIQFIIGNLIQPKMMGQSLDLHPVMILLSLIFFGTLWGIIGMFLASPVTAVIKLLFERFEYTKPIAELMSGKIDLLTKKKFSKV
jgi:AI-2 transport protein TqsA